MGYLYNITKKFSIEDATSRIVNEVIPHVDYSYIKSFGLPIVHFKQIGITETDSGSLAIVCSGAGSGANQGTISTPEHGTFNNCYKLKVIFMPFIGYGPSSGSLAPIVRYEIEWQGQANWMS